MEVVERCAYVRFDDSNLKVILRAARDFKPFKYISFSTASASPEG